MRDKNFLSIGGILATALCCVCLAAPVTASRAEAITGSPALTEGTVTAERSKGRTKLIPIDPDLRKKLRKVLKAGGTRHVLAQFSRYLTIKEKRALAKLGIEVRGHLGSFIWRVTLADAQTLGFTNPSAAKAQPVLGLLRALSEIQPHRKITPRLLKEGVFPKHRHEDGTVEVHVGFYRDVSVKAVDRALRRQRARRLGKLGMLNDAIVRIPKQRLLRLAAEDEVKWITLISSGDSGSNDNVRAAINSDPVNSVPYNLTGSNVKVGIWDTGVLDGTTHGDLAGRVTAGELGHSNDDPVHATHVAGTLAGSGTQSDVSPNTGTSNQWRGVAPSAQLYSYTIHNDDYEVEEHVNSMINNGIDLSNNSWGEQSSCFFYNGYTARSQKFDQLVSGTFPGSLNGPTPPSPAPLPVVFAAGNNGLPSDCGGTKKGSFRVPGATAKNPIVVGDVDLSTSPPTLAPHSSRGPTEYDMLKPDVVAPGCSGATSCAVSCSAGTCNTCSGGSCGTAAIRSTVPTDTYDLSAGTSMAAAAVTGTMALMLEQYRRTYFNDANSDEMILPSTYKAILTHTAKDLIQNPNPSGGDLIGPDYDYGYGLLDAQKSVDTIKEKRFTENVLNDSETDIYAIKVPSGISVAKLRVTLAWDDLSSPFDNVTYLADVVNDLNLLVISPNRDAFYTPWEFNPISRTTAPSRNSISETVAATFADTKNVVEQVEVPTPTHGVWYVKVKASPTKPLSSSQPYSLVASVETNSAILPTQLLGPEVNIMQVLDRSGSMNSTAGEGGTDTKLQVLQSEAKFFIGLMKTGEPHKLGLVQFNHDLVPFPSGAQTDLDTLTSARQTNLTTSGTSPIDAMIAGGATSIGDGLEAARMQLTSVNPLVPHRAILLVTDGKENAAQMIAEVQDNLINEGIRVYPLGLGYGTGIDAPRLSALADDTGGAFRIAADDPDFRKLYLEILAGAIDWSVSVDPVYKLAAGETITVPAPVTHDETAALFAIYWQDMDQAVELVLITPSGQLIQPSDAGGSLRYGDDSRHAYFKIDLPWPEHAKKDWVGTWQMRLTGRQSIPSGKKVRVSASALVKGGVHLHVSFDKPVYRTGEAVLATARLKRNHRPVAGARVVLYCDIPTAGAGNVLHNGQVDPNALDPSAQINGDQVRLMDQKLRLLERRVGKSLLTRGTLQVPLLDDGTHDDGIAGDGIYANSFSNTRVPGTFSCRFLATDIATGRVLKTQREWTIAFHNEVAIDADHSDIDVRLVAQTADGYRYKVKVVPRDRFGNYLGPGHPVTVSIQKPGSKPVLLNDPLVDGTYQGEIFLLPSALDQDVRLLITVRDQAFATLRPPGLSPWSLGLHGGTNDPRSRFGNNLNSDLSLGIDLEYRFNDTYAAELFLGRDEFDGKSGFQDVDVTHLSLNGKKYFLSGPTKPFVSVGVGRYDLDPGSTNSGFSLGTGVQLNRSQRFAVEATLKFHSVDTSGSNSEFYTLHGGLRYRFRK